MNNILEILKAGKVLISDGAMGTMLFRRGLDSGDCPEKINLETPEVLSEIAFEYLEAGADIIQTNSFGGSAAKLDHYGLADKTEEINKIAVVKVKEVVSGKAFVSGSVGPTGRMLNPYGDAEPEELYDGFIRQIGALISAGADLICVETMTDLTEATLAVKAAKELNPSIPVVATMTFDETPRGFYTIMGIDIKKAASELENTGADIVGSNCGNGIENMVKIAAEFKETTNLPIIIQSNAGMPELIEGKLTYNESPEFMASKVEELISLGVSIIGGCCGTTPEHIKSIKAAKDTCINKT